MRTPKWIKKGTKTYERFVNWRKKNRGFDKPIPQNFLPQSKRNPNCKCIVCDKGFYSPPSRKGIGNGKFCSYKCAGEFKKGKTDPNLTYRFPKGNKPWNTGLGEWENRKCKNCDKTFDTLKSQDQVFCSKECHVEWSQNKDWDQLSYGAKHYRINRIYGKPIECENCGTKESKKFEWANISGEYKEERSDWAGLCCKCHRRYDRGTKNKINILCV